MRRREFLVLLGGAAGWPLAASARQLAAPVIGFLRNTSRNASEEKILAAMHQGLKKSGYAEGTNLVVEYRFADNELDRLPALAADLVRRQVAVIVAGGNAASLTAKAATTTIPVVFTTGSDPIQLGLVSSLNRPGGNVTGVSFLPSALGVKRLQLLHELVPKVATIAYLANPHDPNFEQELQEMRAGADALSRHVLLLSVGSERDLVPAFARLAEGRAGALLVGADSLFLSLSDRLVALAMRQALPMMHYLREVTAAGGLMSYGASITDSYRQAGIYTGGILKGASPADLPIVLPTRFELVINLTTAKTLGIDVPLSLMVRADEIID
jgi:ABC-type uncharacterized transport system substrate-binding protein